MEFIYVKDTTLFKFLSKVLARVYQGEHLAYRNVHVHRGKKLKVEGERAFLVDIDGEVEKAQRICIEVLPKAVRMLIAD